MAEEVHHIIHVESGADFNQMRALAYDFDNLESVCREHHHKLHEQNRHKWLTKAQRKEQVQNQVDNFLNNFGEWDKNMEK